MCRLMFAIGVPKNAPIQDFMKAVKVPMTVGNKDGIGYSAVKPDGSFFTERWHNTEMFMTEKGMSASLAKKLEKHKEQLGDALKVNYSLYGSKSADLTTVTMHTRYATCGKEFENVHPFVDHNTSLVHNGVISNANALGLNRISSCDSESALQAYIKHKVNLDITNAQDWIDSLSGYWAFGILSVDASGRRVIDVIRNSAPLYVSRVNKVGLVLATTDTIIEVGAKEIKSDYEKPEMLKANVLFRLDAVTGQFLQKIDLKDSVLNRTPDYKKPYNASDYDDYDYYNQRHYNSYSTTGDTGKKNPNLSVVKNTNSDKDEEGFPKEPSSNDTRKPTVNSDPNTFFDYIYNDDEPIIDRLYLYDEAFGSNYGETYELLPYDIRVDILQAKDFDEVLECLDQAAALHFGGGH